MDETTALRAALLEWTTGWRAIVTALGVLLNNDGNGHAIYSSFDSQPVTFPW